jgi:hypothetical protein
MTPVVPAHRTAGRRSRGAALRRGRYAVIRATLAALVKEGEIVRGADGRYRLAKYAGLPH